MEQTVAQLGARLNKIELEYSVATRRRAESARRAFKSLSEISPEDVELLKGVVPSLAIIKNYSEQDIIDNLNGEIETIRRVATELRDYVEHRLSFYEEQL